MLATTADASPIGGAIDSSALGAHEFAIDPVTHGHEAHWSWIGTPPTDAPAVTSVSYFVHSDAHGGAAMTAAQIVDIDAAAAAWSGLSANLELVPEAVDADADIHMHMDTSSGCGPGAIGCSEFAFFVAHDALTYGDGHPQHEMLGNTVTPLFQVLTILDESTFAGGWYSGPVAGIGAAEYDFLTVATQELGHHLGLEHNDAGSGHADFGSSPMNGSLPIGLASRRIPVASDGAVLIDTYGAAVPEPSTALLIGLGWAGAAWGGRRGRRD